MIHTRFSFFWQIELLFWYRTDILLLYAATVPNFVNHSWELTRWLPQNEALALLIEATLYYLFYCSKNATLFKVKFPHTLRQGWARGTMIMVCIHHYYIVLAAEHLMVSFFPVYSLLLLEPYNPHPSSPCLSPITKPKFN